MLINFNHIQRTSYVDGPGRRTVLFMQGCPLACPGCQNKHLWPADGGHTSDTETVAQVMVALLARDGGRAVTISGGEPFSQPAALADLLARLRSYGVINIMLYSGYTWEILQASPDPAVHHALSQADTLVDGPFVASQDDPLIAWRGSRNQRVINVPASLITGRIVTRDWSKPVVIVTNDGETLFPVGLAPMMAQPSQIARRCGETRKE